MNLQVNNSGSWKNVFAAGGAITFNSLAEAMAGAEIIGQAAASVGHEISFRVIDKDEKVVAHWSHADGWTIHAERLKVR